MKLKKDAGPFGAGPAKFTTPDQKSIAIVPQDEAERTAALAEHRAKVAAADRVFQTLRNRFALAGCELLITAVDGRASFVIARWGLLRECATLADLEAFAAQVGGCISAEDIEVIDAAGIARRIGALGSSWHGREDQRRGGSGRVERPVSDAARPCRRRKLLINAPGTSATGGYAGTAPA